MENGVEAGRYILDDPFKPYLHPLHTPAGHLVTDCMPADHRHHKGLMFALRCVDLNFWEEPAGTDQCGVQRSISIEPLGTTSSDAALSTGIRQRLSWEHESGDRATYDEVREIFCHPDPTSRAFVWTWRSHRTALRAHRLIKSEWSLAVPDGRKINYHGLGIRLPLMWAFGDDRINGAELGGRPASWAEICGTNGPEIGCWGMINGFWNPPIAAVTLRQTHGYGWFAIKAGFAYLSAGPSNINELDVTVGQTFSESYQVVVQDR